MLGGDAINEMLFDLECAAAKPAPDAEQGPHVFIAGLARSGTTILLQQLYESGVFCSLTYRDMPFVMAPNLWAVLAQRFARTASASVRAHGDGVLVDFDSPEALEEVFWRVHCAEQYLRPDCLLAMQAAPETLEKFRLYIALILHRYGCARYLSKNNNNLLRVSSLRTVFPDAVILVPFRQPLQQAASLHRQHQKFGLRHADDAFSRRYMRWLVHHEFGLDQKPFLAPDALDAPGPDSLDYWLTLWLRVYHHLSAQAVNQTLQLFCYEQFCERPDAVWAQLSAQLRLPESRPQTDLSAGVHTALPAHSATLADQAQELYQQMRHQGSAG